VPDNILFNGTNVNAQGGGKRLQIMVEPGKRYLMRFINTGVDDFYKVGIGK
jgi:Multicopper oxidase